MQSAGPLPPDEIDAVVFDMGGVFAVPAPGPVSQIVRDAGVPLELDDMSARLSHYSGVAAITALLADIEVGESDPAVWQAYDRAYFSSAGLSGEALTRAIAARQSARVSGDSAAIWRHVIPENRQGFSAIAGLRPVAVVTNNNGTAIAQCLEMELCQIGPGPLPEVAAIVDSGVIGIAKPDPRIFTPALEALGTSAARTLYVGDTVHADVLGASAAGMPVVQLDPYDHHTDYDHWRLPDLVALAAYLA